MIQPSFLQDPIMLLLLQDPIYWPSKKAAIPGAVPTRLTVRGVTNNNMAFTEQQQVGKIMIMVMVIVMMVIMVMMMMVTVKVVVMVIMVMMVMVTVMMMVIMVMVTNTI